RRLQGGGRGVVGGTARCGRRKRLVRARAPGRRKSGRRSSSASNGGSTAGLGSAQKRSKPSTIGLRACSSTTVDCCSMLFSFRINVAFPSSFGRSGKSLNYLGVKRLSAVTAVESAHEHCIAYGDGGRSAPRLEATAPSQPARPRA